MTIGLFDIEIPKDKQARLDKADEDVLAIDKQFQRGLITDDERYEQVVGICFIRNAEGHLRRFATNKCER